MNAARLHQSGFVESSSRRESVGFAAIATFCVALAAAEVVFGMAEPWPAGITWSQVAAGATAHAVRGVPMVAAK